MSDETSNWPALANPVPTPSIPLAYQRGVWGKPHGTSYGFRWVARSEGFPRDDHVAWALPLGNEDDPCRMYFWRCLPGGEGGADRHFAGTAYLSQAQDAAGRSGFLEKQIAEWTNRQGRPAAFGAFGLLSMMVTWDDAVWWDRRDEVDWSQGDNVLPLAEGQPVDLPLGLAERIGQGLKALFQETTEEALAAFYMRLLAGESPACLYAAEPLSPLALVALLLPLPRETADRLSLAGWVPSCHYAPQDFAGVWDVLAMPSTWDPGLSTQAEACQDKAGKIVRALRENNPGYLSEAPNPQSLPEPVEAIMEEVEIAPITQTGVGNRPRPVLELDPPAEDSPALATAIHAFAKRNNRWDLDLGAGDLQAAVALLQIGQQAGLAAQIDTWIGQMDKQGHGREDGRQWDAKLDQLRALALALAPSPGRAHKYDLEKSRIPALCHAPSIMKTEEARKQLLDIGADMLARVIEQSLRCPSMENELNQWLEGTNDLNIRKILNDRHRQSHRLG